MQAPAAAEDKSPPENLLEQLGSKDFAEREQAAKLLQARGPSVLAILRQGLNHSDAEVRRRVQALLPPLEALVALEPKRVTLKADKQSLSAAIKEINKQTGYHLEFDGNDGGKVYAFEMKGVPFWEALERLRRQSNEAVNIQFLEKEIQLKKREGRPTFISVNGPFRMEVIQLHEDRDIDFTEAGKGKEIGLRDHRLTLTVSVVVEPRFILIAVDKAHVEIALDEERKLLQSPQDDSERPNRRMHSMREILDMECLLKSQVALQRSSETAKSIKSIRGNIPVVVVVERKQVVVTDKVLESKGAKCRVGNGTLMIKESEIDEKGDYQITIALPADQDGIRLLWHDRIFLEDAIGNKYKPHSTTTTCSGNDQEVSYSYGQPKDPKVGPPSKLIIEDWVILRHSIPFEFKDVPLP